MHRQDILYANLSKTVISELVEIHTFIHGRNVKQAGFWARKLSRNKKNISTVSHMTI